MPQAVEATGGGLSAGQHLQERIPFRDKDSQAGLFLEQPDLMEALRGDAPGGGDDRLVRRKGADAGMVEDGHHIGEDTLGKLLPEVVGQWAIEQDKISRLGIPGREKTQVFCHDPDITGWRVVGRAQQDRRLVSGVEIMDSATHLLLVLLISHKTLYKPFRSSAPTRSTPSWIKKRLKTSVSGAPHQRKSFPS